MAKKEKEQFWKECYPITRKIFHQQFLTETYNKEEISNWNELEKKIYLIWKDKTFFQLKKKNVLHVYLSCVKNDDLSKNYNIIKKLHKMEENERKQKQLSLILETIEFYRNQKKKLYQLIDKKVSEGITPNLCELKKEIDAMFEQRKTSLKAVKTAIKEATEAFESGEVAKIETLAKALDPKASADNDIYAKQVSLVTKTYIVVEKNNITQRDVPDEIKKITFNFIKGCAEYASYLHVNLINYIFLNETISEEAFDLLKNIKGDLLRCGMAILPYANAQTIVNSKKLRHKKTLSTAEKRLIAIMELYDPQVPSIH